MPTINNEKVVDLLLDLRNYRTIPQQTEESAINAMIAINPDWFWALTKSLLDDGYEQTENIVVLRNDGKLLVKEGNRRVGILKLIHGHVKNIDVPDDLIKRINALSKAWLKTNSVVPCAIYETTEVATVEKLVARIHAKGEKAGRDNWNAVAKARFDRDERGKSEPGLDLLENYLKSGKKHSAQQAERWAGDYPLSVLDEAIQKLSQLLGNESPVEVVSQYPKKYKKLVDDIVYDIGIGHLGFKELRDNSIFWAGSYGLSSPKSSALPTATAGVPSKGAPVGQQPAKIKGIAAYASNDPKAVRRKLRAFNVKGKGRDKLAALLIEIRGLKHEAYPHAFCFLLRSMFELSAKAYCADHSVHGGPSTKKKDGSDKELAILLREIVNHMTGNRQKKDKVKILHGAITELAKKDGILSVTSMNQLIHNPSFSIQPSDISIMFGNIFPLLEELNS